MESKLSGWKLKVEDKHVTFKGGFGIGTMKFKGSWDLMLYLASKVNRVRIVRQVDGYAVQFLADVERHLDVQPTGKTIGIDVGLRSFSTDSEGHAEPNPCFSRNAEQAFRKLGCRVSRKVKGRHHRKNKILARKHLRIQRQRKDHAVNLSRCSLPLKT